ncbi:MAG: glycosyltransferase [Acidobacteriota bacterium]|nr:glycosyltransferase [Acidobacteriota bacterium]
MSLSTVLPEKKADGDEQFAAGISLQNKPEAASVRQKRIAVLIPCYNEELTVGEVVDSFRAILPQADIYVYDNNSQDKTVEKAKQAGAIVRYERRQGKGFVVQRMFREVEADVYIMIDGDSTYPPGEVWKLINPVLNQEADMVVGSRLMSESSSEFKKLNRFGNKIFLWTINYIFGVRLTDILSGYRAFNRNFVKNLPLFGGGFEIETELTIKALTRDYQIVEIPIDLGVRPEGSSSKINYLRDGFLILNMILSLFRDYKPLTFFGAIGIFLMLCGLPFGGLVIYEFLETGLVLRLPSAVLAVGLELAGMLSLTIGLVLHTIVRRSMEMEYQLRVIFDEFEKNQKKDE